MINGKGVKEMYRITNETVIGGNKVVTPFGELVFTTTYETEDAKVANYFRDRIGFTVIEVDAEGTD